MRRLLAAVALAAASAPASAACPDPPGYASLRYEEDYGHLADPACRTGPLDALKHLGLGAPDRFLSFGGELRTRVEHVRRPDFGLDLAEDQVFLQRALLHADLRLGAEARAFVQLGAHFAGGREQGDGPTDENRLDLQQAFVDLSADAAGGRATLRAGRQELSLGSSRLVSVRESPNVRRAFDGARGMWRRGAAGVDAVYLRPVAPGRGAFDDAASDAEELYGLYATLPMRASGPIGADLYYLGYRRERARFARGTGTENRHSFGIRLFGERRGADWDVEAVYQIGSFGAADIAAWTIATDVGHMFEGVPWRPRLGLKVDVASGDGDPGDGRLGTFNALYPKLPYFTEAGLVAPANVVDVHPTVEVAPTPKLILSAGANPLWRHRRADAFYAPPLAPVAALAGGDRYVGTQAEVSAEWRPSRHVEVKAWYVRFFAGDAVERIGGGDVRFVAGSVAFKF